MPSLTFENGLKIQVAQGQTSLSVLELANANGIAHTSVCGGNGLCSTCKIWVENLSELSPCTAIEQELLLAKGEPQGVRLACQAKVVGDAVVKRLVFDEIDQELVRKNPGNYRGNQQEIAVLFCDIRNFTSFSEKNQAYDVVHFLNRYFFINGNIILEEGGYIDKYIGDGLMALFGINGENARIACANATQAALKMLDASHKMSEYTEKHFGFSLRIGVGIAWGKAIVGKVGHPDSMAFTAIGDTVNLASRIEAKTKELKVDMLVDEQVDVHLPATFKRGKRFNEEIKGKEGSFPLVEILPNH
jgi:adenylate cyclase